MSNESSSGASENPRQILVTGDVCLEVTSYQGDTISPSQPGKITPYHSTVLGGAKQLYDIISTASSDAIAHFGLDPLPLTDPQRPHLEVHTLWRPNPGGLKKEYDDVAKKDKPREVWRVAEPLGYSIPGSDSGEPPFEKSDAASKPSDILVIDDAGLGFRTKRAAYRWPLGVKPEDPQPNWIVMKMSNPLTQGDLWRTLIQPSASQITAKCSCPLRQNLIVIVSANELRSAGAAISRGFSWERTLTELCIEVDRHPVFKQLLCSCRHLIINFDCVGAVWFDNTCCTKIADSPCPHPQRRAQLIYDPTLTEGQWESLLAGQAKVYGHLNTFTAAIVLALFDSLKSQTAQSASAVYDKAVFVHAIERAISAARFFRLLGHGPCNAAPVMPWPALAPILRDPSELANNDIRKAATINQKRVAPDGYQTVSFPENFDLTNRADWTLASLTENPGEPQSMLDLPLYGLAHRVALYGINDLRHLPHARFGVLVSIDRYEIETLRALHQRIAAYQAMKLAKQPLCLAAFGPPGAGKSFGIKQIAKEVLGPEVPILEFNLSQYDSPAELIGAYHQVRDAVLKGSTPVVFWDEFDAQGYKWLQYLLAPMQDGTFQEAGHTHTLGKCIFVFAGGTSWDFEHFGPAPMPEGWQPEFVKSAGKPAPEIGQKFPEATCNAISQLGDFYQNNPDRIKSDQLANDDFRQKKGPDFLSRLDGYINVLGPNRRHLYDWSRREWATSDAKDITFPVRRAILLRQFLGAKKDEDTLDINRDLLRAFLLVPSYRHGARSLEKIALPLASTGRPFRRANLPPPQVLEQHLDSSARFDELYSGNLSFLTPDNLRRLASAIADYYDSLYTPGYIKRTASEAKAAFDATAANTNSWNQWLVATNISAAQRLPYILSFVGLRLEPGTSTPAERGKVSQHLRKHLDVLAKEEHDLWTKFHKDNGWQQANKQKLAELVKLKVANKAEYKKEISRLKKEDHIHTLLVPFCELPDEEKDKDHAAIGNYPTIVALVDWKITFIEH